MNAENHPKQFKWNSRICIAMRACAIALLIVISLCLVTPALAANEDRYGYLKVQDVTIRLDNGTAAIHVNYAVDEGTRFIFFLLGKQDLKKKLLKILNYDEAQITRIDLSSADFIVDDAAFSYGNGIYWYPSHEFNVAIPNLTIHTPQVTRNFTMVKAFPAGMGFFASDNDETPPYGIIEPGYPEIRSR
jgi:hypothetical protein